MCAVTMPPPLSETAGHVKVGETAIVCCEGILARWVAIFDDSADMSHVRCQFEAEHLAYLDAHKDKILIAGGLRSAPGGPFLGGLWVLEVRDSDEAVGLIELDPYHRHGQRAYRLLAWGKAFDRAVVL